MKMHGGRQKWFVMLQKNNGFTLIEMLISLVVFMVISMLAVQVFSAVHTHTTKTNELQVEEWEMFSLQIQRELRNSKEQAVKNNRLYLLVNGAWITVEHYQNIVRRQVDGGGHDVMLQNISSFQVEQRGTKMIVHVTDQQKHTYSRTFHPYLKKAATIHE